MPDHDPVLLDKARAVKLDDSDVALCWQYVLRGIEVGWLDEGELRDVVQDLRDGVDHGVEELLFERRADLMHVIFLGDDCTCDPDALISALESLIGAPFR
jgi:hypothetical protein